MLKTVVLHNIFVMHLIFLDFLMNKKQHLYETEIFCDIINVSTVTFEKCNASLLKSETNGSD